uniref:RIN4 pathogenic type III effector avirulence factor Avr cleavage site domain-containing protein n=1 Tax=Oryza brachyantha TaxID=4533 RepID=J3MDX3_ORYBR
MEMEKKTIAGCQIPAFGSWNYCDDLPITQCFDQAIKARLTKGRRGGGGERRLLVPFSASVPAPRRAAHVKVIRRDAAEKQWINGFEKMMIQAGRAAGAVYGTAKRKAAGNKPVDEDLYKVPPQEQDDPRKTRKVVWSLWIGCLGLDCIA